MSDRSEPDRCGGKPQSRAAGPAMGPVLLATVVVGELEQAVEVYARWLGFEPEASGELPETLALAWDAPRAAGSRWAILSPGRGRPGGVRLIERSGRPEPRPLARAGWRALELVVSDVRQLREQLRASPLRVVGEPKPLATNPSIVAMQAIGPGGEMLYLTQTSQDTQFELPTAERLVDRMFIAVLSAADLQAAQGFYAQRFGAIGHLGSTPVALEAVNRELGLPVTLPHSICALQLAGACLVEIDEHPRGLHASPPIAGDLPDGLALVSFAHDDLESEPIASLLSGAVQPRPEAPYRGRRAAILRGAAGELIELVESAPMPAG